jgi:hypothetical protein
MMKYIFLLLAISLLPWPAAFDAVAGWRLK